MARDDRFDERYYDRFYKNRKTRVAEPADTERLARFVTGYLAYLHIPLKTVLDVGCGLGMWRDALAALRLAVDYTGLEVSAYLCETYGWTRGSVVDYKPGRKYDLVVCQGVLPYLEDGDLRPAVENLARLCRGALYLEAVTQEDWKGGLCEPKRFDRSMVLRKGAVYREILDEHFTPCGGGVFVPKSSRAVVLELEKG